MTPQGFLVLESGKTFTGIWEGGTDRAGEVVFNTSHSGYEEIASDPSYYHQIMVMTAPMQGNYGAHPEVWESRQFWIEGFVCLEMQKSKANHSWVRSLIDKGIPVLSDVDTRELVLELRNHGTPWGAVVNAKDEAEARAKARVLIEKIKTGQPDWVFEATRRSIEDIPGDNPRGPRIAVFDFGCKENSLRVLKRRCRELRIFPSRASAAEIKAWKPDGIFLSNGPGDPQHVRGATETVRELLGWRYIFGICMGHQILAQALGAKTYKLKFGHRGSNHPIKDEILDKVYVTSQNHGYAVDRETLPNGVRVTHTNLNDGTVSGIMDPERRCLGVQFHPESHPGPHDAAPLFDFFVSQIT